MKQKILCSLLLIAATGITACGSDQEHGEKTTDDSASTVVTSSPLSAVSQSSDAVIRIGPDNVQSDYALDLAIRLADTWINTYQPKQNAWSWDSGVFMMGLMDLWEITGEERFYQYAKSWIDYYLEKGYFVTSSDTSIPGHTALRLYQHEGDSRYLAVADDIWQYISEKASRTSEGGLNHLGIISGNQIWVDSLFMIGPFLFDYARITGKTEPFDEYALQLSVFRKNLRSEVDSLYLHMYDDTKKETTPKQPLYWGRGNGWVFVGYNLARNRLPATELNELGYLQSDRDSMLAALVDSPTVNGRFHTLVNVPESYLETSAGLLYAYGLYLDMLGRGELNTSEQLLAETWIQGAVNESTVDALGNTLLLGTSYGTSPGDINYYNNVLKGENVAYGIGLYLLATSAREKVGYMNTITEPVLPPTESFMQPPVPCEGNPCGKFHLSRGNFEAALEYFSRNPGTAESQFYTGTIAALRVVFDAFYQIDRLAQKDITSAEFLEWVKTEGFTAAHLVRESLQPIAVDSGFTSNLERLVIIEGGGHNAIGAREYDLGEAKLFEGVANLVYGLGLVIGSDPAVLALPRDNWSQLSKALLSHKWRSKPGLTTGFDEIVKGLDTIVTALELIEAETDDQSDDLVPANLIRLEGTFGVPGILVEQDVKELVSSLGIDEATLEQIDAPADLIKVVRVISSTLKVVNQLIKWFT